jgi:TonB family protein
MLDDAMRAKRSNYRGFISSPTPIVSARFALAILVVAIVGLTARVFAQDSSAHRKVLVRVAPEYPETLRIAQIGGVVRLSATVKPDGTVVQVEVRGGNPILAERGQKAVMKWKYSPAPTQTVEEVGLSFSPH